MAEVLDISAVVPVRGRAFVPARPPGLCPARDRGRAAARGPVVLPLRAPRPSPVPGRASGGGMPVIAPMPAAHPAPIPSQRESAEEAVAAGTTVDHLTETYRAHYRSLLGLAALLLDDTASCEDVVQEAFIRVHSARRRVRDKEKTLAYLRQTVVNLSRSALRRRILGLKLLSKPMPDMASAEEGAYDQLERDALIKAMKGLQRRQREVLVLRYFADMTEAQVAATLGISLGSVKAYGSRGIAALRVAMGATA
ncbi:SigE family RNA polymerase sigma factor [Streptomyces spongiicola]|nr:SigE family RNA polymerase sigma factor [Streptomyces spongiicola]